MLELQYFRGILVINNAVSATIAFIVSQQSNEAVFITMGSFLLASWIMSLLLVAYTSHKIGAAKNAGYFRVPLYNDEFGIPYSDPSDRPRFGPKFAALITIADAVFAIAFLILLTIGFIASSRLGPGVAGIGAIVAFVVHTFNVLVNLNYGVLTMYKIRIVIVRRDQEDGGTLTRVTGTKEQRGTVVPSVHESEPDPEPEALSPRPYRGSPSTRPNTGSESTERAKIELIEPAEDAVLIGDHD